MKKKNSAPIIKISPKQAYDHVQVHTAPPITRRDFVSRGLVAGGASILLPSVFGLGAMKSAFGATSACTSLSMGSSMNDVAVLVIDAAGGLQISSFALPPGADGNPLDTSKGTGSLGWSSADTMDSSLIKNLHLRMADGFRNTLVTPVADAKYSQAELTSMFQKTAGAVHSCASNNDTANQTLNPSALISAIQGGVMMNSIIGTRNSEVLRVPGIAFTELKVTNITSLKNSVNYTNNYFTDSNAVSIWGNAINKLSSSQAADLSKRALGSQFLSLFSGSVSGNSKYADPCFSSLLDPTLVTTVNTNFTVTSTSANSTELAIYNALSNLYAPVGTITVGGCDYHDGTTVQSQIAHIKIAQMIQRFFMVCKKNYDSGSPTAAPKAMIYLVTDGGCNMKGTVGQTNPLALNDAGQASGALIIAADFRSGLGNFSNLGFINSAEAASTTVQSGKTPSCVAGVGAATYASLSRNGLKTNVQSIIASALGLPIITDVNNFTALKG